ncbi:hypothetical protein PHLGIDRAFT_274226 [Phlebiopsis gigantea 11061_1 CR5-6]|uniref:Uncharacterized protein n=1 Tax=Phlebiopsis gigantea (strain 11061_1 CR5-6) TaxID=745531 RepID=A0A0C3SE21_PHLG1|nr:hypothetical protein PHLGIDRAFT_274226 [Phlebiopsis gigantea 11061_1 CR5-6]
MSATARTRFALDLVRGCPVIHLWVMLDFFLNFVNDLSPGSTWSRYTAKSKMVLQLMRGNITAIPDDSLLVNTNLDNSQMVLTQMQK